MKAELDGDVIRFEGTEEELAAFLEALQQRCRAFWQDFENQLLYGPGGKPSPTTPLGVRLT